MPITFFLTFKTLTDFHLYRVIKFSVFAFIFTHNFIKQGFLFPVIYKYGSISKKVKYSRNFLKKIVT